MPKFRNRPVVIGAILAGDVLDDCANKLASSPPWIVEAFENCNIAFGIDSVIIIDSEKRAERDDWIIRDPDGKLRPCWPEIFDATYEKIDD